MKKIEEKFVAQEVNSHEFEKLVKEILTQKTGEEYFLTSWNYDEGNDLYCDHNSAIHQCKSTITSVSKKFKDELKKIKNVDESKRFYLYVNVSLSEKFKNQLKEENNITEVYDLSWAIQGISKYNLWHLIPSFKKLVENISDEAKKQEILRFFDDYLIDGKMKIWNEFVETSQYREILEKVPNNNVTVFLGAEGSGKTIVTSYAYKTFMLMPDVLPLYLHKPADYSEVIKMLSKLEKFREDKKIYLLIDDFLGSYLNESNINKEVINNLSKLIMYAREHKIKLLFNCRKEIFNYKSVYISENTEITVKGLWEDIIINHTIDMKDIDLISKTLIFKNSLEKKGIPNSEIDDEMLLTIVRHKNYKPRIIFSGISKNRHLELPKLLDNPEELYNEITRTGLSEKQKIVLEILLKLAKYIKNIGINTLKNELIKLKKFESKKEIDETIDSLVDYCINKFVYGYNKRILIEFINPKIKECIENNGYMLSGEKFTKKISNLKFNEIDFIEQINNLEINENMLNNIDVDILIKLVKNNRCKDEIIKKFILIILKEGYLFSDTHLEISDNLFLELFENEEIMELLCEEGKLKEEFFNDLKNSNFIIEDLSSKLFDYVTWDIGELDDNDLSTEIDFKEMMEDTRDSIFSTLEDHLFSDEQKDALWNALVKYTCRYDWRDIVQQEIDSRQESEDDDEETYIKDNISSSNKISDIKIIETFRNDN